MGRKQFLFIAIPFLITLMFFGCTVVPETEAPEPLNDFDFASLSFPQSYVFRAALVPDTAVPPEAGAQTNGAVVDSFADAWRSAVLRGLPLVGILGGDRVHPWPETNPQCLAQNWRSADAFPNSWGLPNLVMVCRGVAPGSGSAATISGAILDAYGKNRGIGAGNGVEGYGYPLGEPFLRDGKIVQEFSKGIFVQDGQSAVFTPVDVEIPSISAVHIEGIPDDVSAAFAEAKQNLREGRAESDSPLAYIRFSSAWDYETESAGGEKNHLLVSGIYIETCNRGKIVFVLPDSPGLPRRALLVSGDFLSIILQSSKRLPGAEALAPSPAEKTQSAFSTALLAGFALYGVPVTDAVPFAGGNGLTLAQRFARGWIAAE